MSSTVFLQQYISLIFRIRETDGIERLREGLCDAILFIFFILTSYFFCLEMDYNTIWKLNLTENNKSSYQRTVTFPPPKKNK